MIPILTKEIMENKLRLDKKFIDYLSDLPESGMGYQTVEIVLKDGSVLINRIILNSSFLKLKKDEQITNSQIKDIKLKTK